MRAASRSTGAPHRLPDSQANETSNFGGRAIMVAEDGLSGGLGDGLVRGRTGAAHGVRLRALRQHRHERYLTRNVRRDNRWNDGAVHDGVDILPVDVRALNELRYGKL